jgi:hypothetical protein
VESVCDSASALTRSRKVIGSCVVLVLCCGCLLVLVGTVPACSFYSLKEVQGYRMLVRGVTLDGKGAQRPQEGFIRW